jgi:hypothetical protein
MTYAASVMHRCAVLLVRGLAAAVVAAWTAASWRLVASVAVPALRQRASH